MSDVSGCECKVGRVTEHHGLADMRADLRAQWTADDDRTSVRDLVVEVIGGSCSTSDKFDGFLEYSF